MKKWLTIFVACAVAIGCGGSSTAGGGSGGGGTGGGGTGGGGTGGGGGNLPTVVLPEAAAFNIQFLSGSNRRPIFVRSGSQTVKLGRVMIEDAGGGALPQEQTSSDITVKLDGYTLNDSSVYSAVLAGPQRHFSNFPLEIKEFTENGSTVWSGLFQKDVALDMMLYPGRVSTALVRLNDSWLWYDGLSGSIEQDEAFFREDNYSPITNKDMAFLSDLVTFDISDMPTAEKPVMEISGGKADRLHFSGDIIAYSEGMGDTSELDFLTPLTNAVEPPEPGKIFPSQSGGGGTSLPPFYVVREPDPRDPLLVDEIDAIRGAYRPFTEVLNNIPSFVMMAFPNSEGSEDMQLVAFEQSAGKVTEMWQGRMRITGSTGTFELWTLDQLRSASTSNTTSGTVSGVVRSNAMAREGDFVVTTTGSGWPFAGSGRFLVFRR